MKKKRISLTKQTSFNQLYSDRLKVKGLSIDSPGTKLREQAYWIEPLSVIEGWRLWVSIVDAPLLFQYQPSLFETLYTQPKNMPNAELLAAFHQFLGLYPGSYRPVITTKIDLDQTFTPLKLTIQHRQLKNIHAATYPLKGVTKGSIVDNQYQYLSNFAKHFVKRKSPSKKAIGGIVISKIGQLVNQLLSEYLVTHNIPCLNTYNSFGNKERTFFINTNNQDLRHRKPNAKFTSPQKPDAFVNLMILSASINYEKEPFSRKVLNQLADQFNKKN